MELETLCKLYLELANVVPPSCISVREKKLRGVIRMLIADQPWQNAPHALRKFAAEVLGDGPS